MSPKRNPSEIQWEWGYLVREMCIQDRIYLSVLPCYNYHLSATVCFNQVQWQKLLHLQSTQQIHKTFKSCLSRYSTLGYSTLSYFTFWVNKSSYVGSCSTKLPWITSYMISKISSNIYYHSLLNCDFDIRNVDRFWILIVLCTRHAFGVWLYSTLSYSTLSYSWLLYSQLLCSRLLYSHIKSSPKHLGMRLCVAVGTSCFRFAANKGLVSADGMPRTASS